MEIENTGIALSLSGNVRTADTIFSEYDLPDLIDKMKESNSWKRGEMTSKVLLNIPDRQIVLTALHEDTEIDSSQTSGSVTFRIVEGKVFFKSVKESALINKGQVLTLNEQIDYSLTAREETILLLTINKEKPGQGA